MNTKRVFVTMLAMPFLVGSRVLAQNHSRCDRISFSPKADLLSQWLMAEEQASSAEASARDMAAAASNTSPERVKFRVDQETVAQWAADSQRNAIIARSAFTTLDERFKHESPELYQWAQRDKPFVVRDIWVRPPKSKYDQPRLAGSGLTEGTDYSLVNCRDQTPVSAPSDHRLNPVIHTLNIPLRLICIALGGPLANCQ